MGKARTATIRAVLMNIPARIGYSARVHTLHMPAGSRRETLFQSMFTAVMAPPQSAGPCAHHAAPGPSQHHPDTPTADRAITRAWIMLEADQDQLPDFKIN